MTVEVTDPVKGSWAEKLELCKAKRAYACEKGVKLVDVTDEMVKATELGIRGYANLFSGMDAAQPKPGCDGTSKPTANPKIKPAAKATAGLPPRTTAMLDMLANPNPNPNPDTNPGKRADPGGVGETPNPKRSKRDNTQGKKEREVKELLAQEQASDNAMSIIASEMSKDPTVWKWIIPSFSR